MGPVAPGVPSRWRVEMRHTCFHHFKNTVFRQKCTGIYTQIFTIFYNRVNESVESRLVKFRRMTAGCATGHVLEIGPGTGANLSFYPSKSKVTVLDPNVCIFIASLPIKCST